jgi:hypothetical protein
MSATVRVHVLVEVTLGASWGDDCSVGQVRAQGTREAVDAVRRLVHVDGSKVRVVEAVASDMVIREAKP